MERLQGMIWLAVCAFALLVWLSLQGCASAPRMPVTAHTNVELDDLQQVVVEACNGPAHRTTAVHRPIQVSGITVRCF